MRPSPKTASLLAAALAAGTAWPAAVLADPIVGVYVTGNAPGVTVTVTAGGGAALSCRTDDTGSCEIAGLRPGRATVVAGTGTRTSPSQTVLLPPDGKVSLIVPSPL